MAMTFRGWAAAGALIYAVPAIAHSDVTVTLPRAEQLSAETFAQLPFLSNALLSPDGGRIAGRLSQDGSEFIAVWTLSQGPTQQPRLIPAGNVESFHWANDERILISATSFLAIRFGGVLLPVPARTVINVDLTTSTAAPIGPAGSTLGVIFTDPAGRYVLLSTLASLNTTPRVVRVDLATNESVEVQPPVRGVWSWFADSSGVVRVGVDYGERRTRIYYRADAQGPLQLVDTTRNVNDDSVIDSVRFVNDTSRGIVITNAETGRFAVYDYDFATDTRGAMLFGHPEVDVERAIFGSEGELDGITYTDDRPRVRWIDPELSQLQERIDQTFPDRTNLIVNQSRDGNRVLIFSSAPDDPGTYYVYDQAGRRMETFASPYDRLIGHRFAPTRPVRYQSRDGLTIRGYLTLPQGRPERGLPLIVMPHGGPFARDSWGFDPQVQFLASRGYAVLQPNFRGSTGYGRDFVERGYGQLGTGMIDDIDDGVEWLVHEGVADRARVCIMGASYGGYAAVWAAMRGPERYRCAISLAGPSDLRTMVRYDVRYLLPRRYAPAWRRQIQGEDRIDLDAVSPARNPEMLRVPLLIAHGEQDRNVPPDQSRRLIRALERRGATIESVFYPKSAHGFTDAVEAADFMRRVETFLNRHNPANLPANVSASS